MKSDGTFALENLKYDSRFGPWFFVYRGKRAVHTTIVGPVAITSQERRRR